MTTTKITRENFTAAMRQAVAEKDADYIYPEDEKNRNGACQYRKVDGTPSCLIGQALYIIDPDLCPEREFPALADEVLCNLGVTDRTLTHAAREAQAFQDEGGRWVDALDRYFRALNKS